MEKEIEAEGLVYSARNNQKIVQNVSGILEGEVVGF